MKRMIFSMAVAMLMLAGCHSGNQVMVEQDDADAIGTIMSRKSVRSFTGDSIPAEVMQTLLKAAMAAPSGMNLQPWSVVVVDDKSQLEAIFGDNHNMRMFQEAGAVVVFCADTTFTRPPRENPDAEPVTQPNPMWRDDMGAVTENFLLAAEACGLGACWTACYPFRDRMEPVQAALGLPPTVLPYSVVPVGYPAGDNQPKDKWDPSRVHYNRW